MKLNQGSRAGNIGPCELEALCHDLNISHVNLGNECPVETKVHCPSNSYPCAFSYNVDVNVSYMGDWKNRLAVSVKGSIFTAFLRDLRKFRTKSKCVTMPAKHQPHAGIVTYSIIYKQMSIELNPVHGQCFSISKTATWHGKYIGRQHTSKHVASMVHCFGISMGHTG